MITKLSFFPREGEILLWPGQKYVVTRPVYVEGGRHYIDRRIDMNDGDHDGRRHAGVLRSCCMVVFGRRPSRPTYV